MKMPVWYDRSRLLSYGIQGSEQQEEALVERAEAGENARPPTVELTAIRMNISELHFISTPPVSTDAHAFTWREMRP